MNQQAQEPASDAGPTTQALEIPAELLGVNLGPPPVDDKLMGDSSIVPETSETVVFTPVSNHAPRKKIAHRPPRHRSGISAPRHDTVQLQPHHIEAEDGLIACLLIDKAGGGEVIEKFIAAGLKPEYCYKTANQTLVRAILHLHCQGHPLDEIILLDYLRKHGLEDEVGGIAAIYAIQGRVETPMHAQYFIRIVRDCYIRRFLIRKNRESIEHIERGDDPRMLLEKIDSYKVEANELLDHEADKTLELLNSKKFDLSSPPPQDKTIFTFGATEVANPGNMGALSGAEGLGKTALITGGMAAALSPGEFLGWKSPNQNGAVIHIDTEQSRADFHNSIGSRVHKRAGLTEQSPRFFSYCLTGLDPPEILKALELALEEGLKACGSIHSIWVDGVGDLVFSPNDEPETFELVRKMHELAIRYETFFWLVIHVNPGSDKTRGHLGSQIQRKAQTCLRLKADGEGTSIFTTKTRRAPIHERNAVRMAWCDYSKMFISAPSKLEQKQAKKDIECIDMILELAAGDHHITWSYPELITSYCDHTAKSESTAKRFLQKAKGSASISHNPHTGKYTLGPQARKHLNQHGSA